MLLRNKDLEKSSMTKKKKKRRKEKKKKQKKKKKMNEKKKRRRKKQEDNYFLLDARTFIISCTINLFVYFKDNRAKDERCINDDEHLLITVSHIVSHGMMRTLFTRLDIIVLESSLEQNA